MIKIADLPQFNNRTQVLTCAPADTVYDAVVSMAFKNCGAIAVTEGDKLVGIFTERDLLARVVGQGRDVEVTNIAEVMSMGRMSHGRFRHLPVIDDNGMLLGMLSQGDLVAYALRAMKKDMDKT